MGALNSLDAVLSANKLAKSYGSTRILSDATLSVAPGEFLAIVGPSGSGKSTLLHILGCVERPDAGDLTLSGQDLRHLRPAALANLRNRTLGFVFQFFYFEPYLTVAKNLEVPLMPLRVPTRGRQTRVRAAAELVGIADQLRQKPATLSGGQLQRAAIARALINRPKILLADEPTGNLDRANTERILDLLLQIKREQHTALIVVTHDEQVAARADRVLHMSDGRLTAC